MALLIMLKMTQDMFPFDSLMLIIAELQETTLTISNLNYVCSTTF